MASKTVWIVGGLVVAIGAIAYLSHNKAPAGKDAAGTIVEAKRARADGTNSFNPAPTASTTEQNAGDSSKGTAGADAAKDAAAAAAGGDNNHYPKAQNTNAVGGPNYNASDAQAATQAAGGLNSRALQSAKGLQGTPNSSALQSQQTQALQSKE
jgi:hypothetical protein